MECNCKDCMYSAMICLRGANKNPKKKFVMEYETCTESEPLNKWKDKLVNNGTNNGRKV
jgi:hypothetical protein